MSDGCRAGSGSGVGKTAITATTPELLWSIVPFSTSSFIYDESIFEKRKPSSVWCYLTQSPSLTYDLSPVLSGR
jgi:hypothetical protein